MWVHNANCDWDPKKQGCSSFLAGTAIAIPGGHKNIEDIAVGDYVLSRNEQPPYLDKPQKVTKLFSRIAPEYMVLQTEFGKISATPEHPFWVQSLAWQYMANLEYNDILASRWGDVNVYDIEVVETPTKVYNFAVENTPSYFATDVELWVHNANCDWDPDRKGDVSTVAASVKWKGFSKGQLKIHYEKHVL